MSEWTGERVATLKARFAAGDSFAEIAKRLGGVSRSACIGKAQRLGLQRSVDQSAYHQAATAIGSANHRARLAAAKAPPVMRDPWQSNGLNFGTRQAAPVLRRDPASFRPLAEGGVRIGELERHHCRWPLGEVGTPEFRLCGEGRVRGDYCQAHAARAYAPPQREDLERIFGRLA